MKKAIHKKKKKVFVAVKSVFWFSVGSLLGIFFCISFFVIIFQKQYNNVVYPGISVGGMPIGGKTQNEVKSIFTKKNAKVEQTTLTFVNGNEMATVSAKQIDFGFNEDLLAKQAYSIGRSENIISNISLILQSYITGVNLSPSYHYSADNLENFLSGMGKNPHVDPIDALFTFENNRVTAFKLSKNGQDLDMEKLEAEVNDKVASVMQLSSPQSLIFNIPIKIIKPKVSSDNINSMGIKEEIGSGTSLYQHSIEGRIYNITLAANRLNGVLVAPDEEFSFDKALGDVSSFTGYKQAYIIQNGKTVLGDGGGVCQVSTTFFRALLNAGLPITERHAHAYRVGYYEEDSPPGFDATIYVPTDDLKFKNDTGHYILIQSSIDPSIQRLTFTLYGTKDGRAVTISKPVITSQTPAPPPLYQDDPTLPAGTIKQVDFAANGATVYFTRQVTKNGKVIIDDKFFSNYRPWQAVYLRGTKEG